MRNKNKMKNVRSIHQPTPALPPPGGEGEELRVAKQDIINFKAARPPRGRGGQGGEWVSTPPCTSLRTSVHRVSHIVPHEEGIMTGPVRIVLLPGMDGTGVLLQDFAARLPGDITPQIVSYPMDQVLGYRQLEERVAAELPSDGPLVLLGESFSGPLALRLSSRGLGNLRAVVLVATFVQSPLWWFPRALRAIIRAPFFQLPPPDWFLRRYLAGSDAPAELLQELRTVQKPLTPSVLAARAREIVAVDATEDLRCCPVPVLYLGGRRDRIVPPARTLPGLKAIRPDLETVILDAPHLVLQRRPAEAAEAIALFLERAI